MTDDRQPAYDAVIPARVRYDPELPDKAKLLYGEIRALASREGFCWATNAYFCRLYDVNERTVQRLISALADRGHIAVEMIRGEGVEHGVERHIWVDRAKFYLRDPDAPPVTHRQTTPDKNVGTPPDTNAGTTPDKNVGENITRETSTRENTPLKSPQGGTGGRKRKEPLPDWEPDRFEKFWRLYPKCESNANQKKADARRAWNQLRPDDDLIGYMGKVLVLQMKTRQWNDGVGVPYASTWIRAFGKDELPDLDTLMALGSGTSPGGWAPDPEVMTNG